jgi:hypothetical protein
MKMVSDLAFTLDDMHRDLDQDWWVICGISRAAECGNIEVFTKILGITPCNPLEFWNQVKSQVSEGNQWSEVQDELDISFLKEQSQNSFVRWNRQSTPMTDLCSLSVLILSSSLSRQWCSWTQRKPLIERTLPMNVALTLPCSNRWRFGEILECGRLISKRWVNVRNFENWSASHNHVYRSGLEGLYDMDNH